MKVFFRSTINYQSRVYYLFPLDIILYSEDCFREKKKYVYQKNSNAGAVKQGIKIYGYRQKFIYVL